MKEGATSAGPVLNSGLPRQRPGLEERLRFPLLAYQRRWIDDGSRLKVAVKARQIGFSFAAALNAVVRCIGQKLTWIFLSKGERQSRLLMEKVREHVQACGIAARASESSFFKGTMTRQLEVRFSNGSVIYGLPANPDTARGYTGNVTLDEFAFHQEAAKIYAALYPTVTRGFSLEVISTPNGQQGKFFELAKAAGLVAPLDERRFGDPAPVGSRHGDALQEDAGHRPALQGWSGHKVSIYDAVEQGFEVNTESLRAGCDDEETWLQEYCCEFLSEAANYVPMELIIGCQSEQATADLADWAVAPVYDGRDAAHRAALQGDLYLGVDIGRKRDLTVAWLIEELGDVKWTRAVVTLRGQTFEVQEKAISDLMEGSTPVSGVAHGRDARATDLMEGSTPVSGVAHGRDARGTVRRCCVDQSGLGMMLAERLQKKYGARVEPVQFTQQVKERLAPRVKQHFEERKVRIPDNREVRADLNAVKRYVTPGGNIRFDAERTERGHADRFWALALALEASATQPAARLAEAGTLVGRPVAAGMMDRIL